MENLTGCNGIKIQTTGYTGTEKVHGAVKLGQRGNILKYNM